LTKIEKEEAFKKVDTEDCGEFYKYLEKKETTMQT
jgi:hypothetical protein